MLCSAACGFCHIAWESTGSVEEQVPNKRRCATIAAMQWSLAPAMKLASLAIKPMHLLPSSRIMPSLEHASAAPRSFQRRCTYSLHQCLHAFSAPRRARDRA
eukprot:COSAG03_NODE_2225_length_2984_cov_3.143847_4_plen_102_part_00